MANTGLNFADDPDDEERYERIIALVEQYYGEALDRPPEDVRDTIARELGQVTPKVAAEAVVFDDEGRVLLVKRSGDGRWCLPRGALDVSHEGEALRYLDVDAVPEWFPMHEEMAVEARQRWSKG